MAKGGFDFRKFQKMDKIIQQMEKGTPKFVEDFLMNTALKALSQIKKRQAGKMGEQFKAVDTGDMLGAWRLSEVSRCGSELRIEIINPKQYASFVEYGHWQEVGKFVPGLWNGNRFEYSPDAKTGIVLNKPWVEGRFMMTVSIQEIERQMPKCLEAAWERYTANLLG